MAFDTLVPGSVQDVGMASFVAASGTAAKILIDITPPRMLAPISGESPPVPRPLQGGQRIIDATASSTNAAQNNLVVFDALQATVVTAVSGAGSVSAPTANTLVRIGGDWRADGIKIGDSVALFAATGPAFVAAEANEGAVFPVTAISADGKTLSTSATLATGQLQVGTRAVRLSQDYVTSVAANAGNAPNIPNTPLLSNGADNSADRIGADLGPASLMVVAMQAAISGAGTVSVRAKARGY